MGTDALITRPEKAYPVTAVDCEDIRVLDDDGQLIYAGPKYLRCKYPECNSLVTHGMVQSHGGCWCGGRRLGPAIRLLAKEQQRLQHGFYPLVEWEQRLIQPTLPDTYAYGWGKEIWGQEHA